MTRTTSPRQAQEALPILEAEALPLPDPEQDLNPVQRAELAAALLAVPEAIELDEAPMALVQVAPRPVAQNPAQEATPMALIQIALQRGAGLDYLERLMTMQERWDKEVARKAYLTAMAEFRANAPSLRKGSKVDFTSAKGRTNYDYADLEEVSMPIGRVMGPLGLSFRWDVKQEGPRVFVTTILQHSAGHSEQLTLNGPADESGNKNSIQAVGSTITYLERYGLLAASGMAVKDQDNDGMGAPLGAAVVESDLFPEGVFQSHLEAIRKAPDDEALKTAYVEALKACPEKATSSIQALGGAKNDRWRELHPKTGGGR